MLNVLLFSIIIFLLIMIILVNKENSIVMKLFVHEKSFQNSNQINKIHFRPQNMASSNHHASPKFFKYSTQQDKQIRSLRDISPSTPTPNNRSPTEEKRSWFIDPSFLRNIFSPRQKYKMVVQPLSQETSKKFSYKISRD